MPDLLRDFEIHFLSQEVTDGASIFLDTILDKPDYAIGIYEYQGANPIEQVDGSTRAIQIVTRDKSVKKAKTLANVLHASLRTEDGIIQLTPGRWGAIHLRHTPFKMKTDPQGRHYYVFNLRITTFRD